MTEQNIQQQKQFKILLIGDDCLDVYQYGTVERISPEAPVPIFKYAYKEERGGMARNVKANLEELGCKVEYLSGKTSVKTRLIDLRSRQHILRIDDDRTSEPIEFVTEIPPVYDAVVISDYNKGTISYELVEEIINSVSCPVFIDTKKTDLARFNGAYVKINALEKSLATTLPDAEWLVVTYGEKGAIWNKWAHEARTVEVADVCGAGDTFLSALVYEYLNTNNMNKAMEFAIDASAVTIQHMGVYAPSLEEIMRV
jgi:D-beta-D-heptose 7-phosphate kinase/D-beta-D-heptose 1-phosphate adenosyltransferase